MATQLDPKRSAGEKSRFLHFCVIVNSQSFVFLDCGVRLERGALQVLVPTQWEPHSINESRALEELRRAERKITRLCSSSPRFSAIVADRPRVFILVYDYGMGGLWMCQLSAGEFAWYEGYPRRSPAA